MNTDNGQGDELALVDALGMLSFAQHLHGSRIADYEDDGMRTGTVGNMQKRAAAYYGFEAPPTSLSVKSGTSSGGTLTR